MYRFRRGEALVSTAIGCDAMVIPRSWTTSLTVGRHVGGPPEAERIALSVGTASEAGFVLTIRS